MDATAAAEDPAGDSGVPQDVEAATAAAATADCNEEDGIEAEGGRTKDNAVQDLTVTTTAELRHSAVPGPDDEEGSAVSAAGQPGGAAPGER